jgi:phage tail sheath gpL-like
MRSMYFTRESCITRVKLRFSRAKATDRTAAAARSELLDVLKKLEELEIVEHVDDNAADLIVERSLQDPTRFNASIPCDVVNGLHVFAGRIDLLL